MGFKATILNENEVQRALKRIAHEIIEKNNGAENICLVGIKRRGVSIAKILADNIKTFEGVEAPTGALDITFYRDDLSKVDKDPVLNETQIQFDIKDKDVILVDDVLYTGRTARAGLDALMALGRPKTVQLAVLIDRGHRELPIRGDYVGKNVPTSLYERVSVKMLEFDDVCSVDLYE